VSALLAPSVVVEEEEGMEHLSSVQREWSERGLLLLRDMLPLMAPVARFSGWTQAEQKTLGMLLSATARSSESVLLLAAYGQLWDAEMVLRSVLEGTMKFVFLLESREEFQARHQEYSEHLFELALLRDHQKAAEFLDGAADSDAIEWRPIRDRLIPDAELQSLRLQYNRTRRRELEQKWGFTALLNGISRNSRGSSKELSSLAWGYALMSHLQHADYVGVALPFDRALRSTERREALQLAHLARLVVDTLTSMANRLTVGYLFVQEDSEPIVATRSRIDVVRKSFGGAYERWAEVEYGTPENE
jgi:hypothetical protein